MLDNSMLHIAREYMRALDTPKSLAVKLLMDASEWDQIARLSVNPLHYEPFYFDGVNRYRRDASAVSFLRKNADLPSSIDLHDVAVDSFLSTEKECFAVNRRLACHLDFPVLETAVEQAAENLFIKARAWIKKTLGPVPDQLNGRFGPGATFESARWDHRHHLVTYDKLRQSPTRSFNFGPDLVDHFVWQTIMAEPWGACCPSRYIPPVKGNRFASVPKDATKNRSIAVEPGLNIWAQLAIGGYLKNLLKRAGLNLVKGQTLHQHLASLGSLDGSISTIDLSNASNTVTQAIVRILLPEDWYDLLSSVRSPFIKIRLPNRAKDVWMELQMFSSMGNGYTFELETLIFAALAYACGGRVGQDTFVYGDDILVPTEISADVLALLRYSGFTPNQKKTFTTGHFRESCGGDYLLGHDVRPFFTTENPDGPSSWIVIANNLWYWSIKWSMPELAAVRNSVLNLIPTEIRRCRGPQNLGDLVIWDHETEWSFVERSSQRFFRVWRPISRRMYLRVVRGSRCKTETIRGPRSVYTCSESSVAIAAAVLGLPSDGLSPRDSVDSYRFGRVPFS